MTKKQRIKFIKKVFFCGVGALFLIAFCIKFQDFNFSLEQREDMHDWKIEGKCIECHKSHYYVDSKTVKEGWNIPPSKYHTEEFSQFSHGRLEGTTSSRCYSCHKKSSCEACHNKPPSSHTLEFINPKSDSSGMEHHIMLGRMRPSSCLVCHKSFSSACTKCHTSEKAASWQEEAEKILSKWTDLHKEK